MTNVTVGELVFRLGTSRPTHDLWCMAGNGQPKNYATGYTFTVAIRQAGVDRDVTSTVTVTPYATPTGDGTDDAHVATLNVAPTVATLAGLKVGPAALIVTATTGGEPAEHEFPARIKT